MHNPKKRRLLSSKWVPVLLFWGLIVLTQSGCAPWVEPSQPTLYTQSIKVSDGETIGQTFVARRSGLAGIEFYILSISDANASLVLHLRSEPGNPDDLVRIPISLDNVTAPGFIRFPFPALSDSQSNYFYAVVEMQGPGVVELTSAPGTAYLDGAHYRAGEPLDGQLTFQLVYDPIQRAIGSMTNYIGWLGVLLVSAWLFLLPGWALLSYFWSDGVKIPLLSKIPIYAGLSVATYALLTLLTDLMNLSIGQFLAWGLPILSAGVVGWKYRRWRPLRGNRKGLGEILQQVHWIGGIEILIVSLLVIVRLMVIPSLEAPMWGDSVQHTMISQLLVENGGLFTSWEPLAELETFTYHFAFHSSVAVFHWVSRIPILEAVLYVGQIFNFLAVLALYPLAMRITPNRWAGLIAVLLAGLLIPTPMVYTNWGRYTQLAGQLVLPVAVYLAWTVLEREEWTWQRLIPLWIALAGLGLSHYRVAVFAVLFFPAFLLVKFSRSQWRQVIMRIGAIGVGAGLLFLPWFFRVFAGKVMDLVGAQLTTSPSGENVWLQINTLPPGSLTNYIPTLIWVLLLTSIGWSIWCQKRAYIMFGLWWGFIAVAANPQWLGLPGTGAISNFTVLIAFYIPAGPLIGAAAGELLSPTLENQKYFMRWIAIGLFMILGFWGANQRLEDLNVNNAALVTRPDVRAGNWIQENTPENARFYVNQFFAFADGVTVGSDAGWWLPILGERAITLPPINYSFEQGPIPDYQTWINSLPREIQEVGITDPRALAALKARDVTHIYIGQRAGRVNYQGPFVLDPQELLDHSTFQLIYHEDRVWIFEIMS